MLRTAKKVTGTTKLDRSENISGLQQDMHDHYVCVCDEQLTLGHPCWDHNTMCHDLLAATTDRCL